MLSFYDNPKLIGDKELNAGIHGIMSIVDQKETVWSIAKKIFLTYMIYPSLKHV